MSSQFDIMRCVGPDSPYTELDHINPGGDILVSIWDWPKVERAFLIVDAIEASGIDPCDVAPDHWRHVHHRLTVAEAPRRYSLTRHRAWLQRKALLP